jgi:NAD(P)-dependent dehydrogenase (short-subunit alcohol dehydrogenase family)
MSKTKNRTVIVTGGSKGIGLAISRAFYEEGYTVVVGSRKRPQELSNLGSRVLFKSTDVRSEKDHLELAKAALNLTGRIDAYVNCAGISLWRPCQEVDSDFWDLIVDTNLKGLFWGCKTAAKVLKKDGCIINVSSLAGKRGSANNSVYCASKFGVNGITQSLAKELGAQGIRVNAVCPVYVKTKGVLEALAEGFSPAAGKDVEDYLNKFAFENSALKRLPLINEVAAVCVFLASAKASAITGQCINVDCGVLPQ